MDKQAKPTTYEEDNFDLAEFQKMTIRKKILKYRKKYQPLINILSYVIFILFLILGVLAYRVMNYYIDLWQNYQISKKVQSITSISGPLNPATPPPSGSEEAGTPTSDTSETSGSLPIREEFLTLMKEFNNDDIVAYLEIEDTDIGYPVVKGTDNEFYLTHDLNKKSNVAGSVFMDTDNNVDVFGYNTVIYGHNMKNKSMFHSLRYYTNEDFYQEHKYISLRTLYEDTTWEIFSFYRSDTKFNYIQTVFPDYQSFQTLRDLFVKKSLYDTGVEVGPDDIILTLSTCSNDLNDTRLVVHSKLISRKN